MKRADYILLIHKQLTGSITSEEADALAAWEAEDAGNHRKAEEIRAIWGMTERYQQDQPHDHAHELDKLMNRIKQDETPVARQRSLREIFSAPLLKYAASLVLVAGIAYYAGHLWQKPGEIVREVSRTSKESTMLPDSSIVYLNRNSTIRYNDRFAQRNVQLTGEAYFDVTPDAENPFRIETANATIQVVGTSFNVRAMTDEDEITVVVTSGIVDVTTVQGTVRIRQGEKCIVYNTTGKLDKQINTDLNFHAWQTKKFEYRKARLETVFGDMERYYGIAVQVEDADLMNCLFNGSFDNASLDEAIDILTFAFGIKMEKVDPRMIKVTGAPCKQLPS